MSKILFSMVVSVNKWLSLPLFMLLAGYPDFFQASHAKTGEANLLHPFHVSTTEINHNAAAKTLEISCRIFTDDFEACLAKVYHTKTDLSSAAMKPEMDSLVKKYLAEHLQIKTDGKPAYMQYLGFEKEEEAVYAYFEAENIPSVKKIEVDNSVLYDMYNDQIGIIHVIVNGNRKSTKLDYPDRQANFSF